MDFSDALRAIKAGNRVTRLDIDYSIYMEDTKTLQKEDARNEHLKNSNAMVLTLVERIDCLFDDGTVVCGWMPSRDDLFDKGWYIWGQRVGESWAERELKLLGNGDDPLPVDTCVMEVLRCLEWQGHSGFSIGYIMDLVNDLVEHHNLTPLTGADDEWGDDVDGKGLRQNKRNGEVFKDADGKAWEIHGKVFTIVGEKSSFVNRYSHIPVKFPFMPHKPEYVTVKQSCYDFLGDKACTQECPICANCVVDAKA